MKKLVIFDLDGTLLNTIEPENHFLTRLTTNIMKHTNLVFYLGRYFLNACHLVTRIKCHAIALHLS